MRTILLLESLYFLIKIPFWLILFAQAESAEVHLFALGMGIVWTLLLLLMHAFWRPLQRKRGSMELAIALLTLLIPLEIRVYSFAVHFRPRVAGEGVETCPPNLTGPLQATAEWVPWIEDGQVRGWIAARVDRPSPWQKLGLKEGDRLVSFEGKPVVSKVEFLRALQRFCAPEFYVEILRGDVVVRLTPVR